MNYGQDYVRECVWNHVLMGAVWGLMCFGVVMLILSLLKRWDKELCIRMAGKEYGIWLIVCACVGGYILSRQQESGKGFLMLIYLILCSVTDYHMQKAYDVAQLCVCLLLGANVLGREVPPSLGGELIVFAGVQAGVFRRMYGEADVMGFLICALSLLEGGMWTWTIHMAITFLFLGIVQGWRHNIGSDGNLKVPVPLFPYMAAAYVFVF